jgi:hypothetical protein
MWSNWEDEDPLSDQHENIPRGYGFVTNYPS